VRLLPTAVSGDINRESNTLSLETVLDGQLSL
jgi:hypothetical protein